MKAFLILYWHNVVGTFTKGFVHTRLFGDMLINIVHLALLPLSLTLAAGIKTIIDFATRKHQSPEVIEAKTHEIEAMDHTKMNELKGTLLAYNGTAKSNSSRELLKELSQLTSKEKSEFTIGHYEHKFKFAVEQLGKEAAKYKPEAIRDTELNPTQQKKLNDYDKLNKIKLSEDKLKMSKKLIIEFLNAEHNSGKKTAQIILGLFNPGKSKVNPETNTNVNSKGLHYLVLPESSKLEPGKESPGLSG